MPDKKSPPPAETPPEEKTTFMLDVELKRAIEQALLDAKRDPGRAYPTTLKDFLTQAAQEKMERDRAKSAKKSTSKK